MAELNDRMDEATRVAEALSAQVREQRDGLRRLREERAGELSSRLQARLDESRRRLTEQGEKADAWAAELDDAAQHLDQARAELREEADRVRDVATESLETVRHDVEELLAEKNRQVVALTSELNDRLEAMNEELVRLQRADASLDRQEEDYRQGPLAEFQRAAEEASRRLETQRAEQVEHLGEMADRWQAAEEKLREQADQAITDLRERVAETVRTVAAQAAHASDEVRRELLSEGVARLQQAEDEAGAILDGLPVFFQGQAQAFQNMYNLLSSLMKTYHETSNSIIQNIGA